MPNDFEPTVGEWYRTSDDRSFEVVAFDGDDQTVEIQYFDGEVEELDVDTWFELDLEPSEPPKDWSGPFDDLERDERGDSDAVIHPEDWSGPLDDLEGED